MLRKVQEIDLKEVKLTMQETTLIILELILVVLTANLNKFSENTFDLCGSRDNILLLNRIVKI